MPGGASDRPEARDLREEPLLLFPLLTDPTGQVALRFGERELSYRALRDAAAAVAERVEGSDRVAVWAVNEPEVAVAVVGALLAGVPIALVNPKAGARELAHVLGDSDPDLLLAPPGAELPAEAAGRRAGRRRPRGARRLASRPSRPTTPRRWSSTRPAPPVRRRARCCRGARSPRTSTRWPPRGSGPAADTVVHGLPLFHVHGLVLGTLGPLRRGGTVAHLGRFSGAAAAAALEAGGTMLFAVPTMYHRLAAEAAEQPEVARALGGARLLVSGSAALPAVEHERIERLTGQRIAERYGMTETLMNTAVRAGGERRPARSGRRSTASRCGWWTTPAPRSTWPTTRRSARSTCAGPNLFLGYLNRPDATDEAMRDGWFRTGDLATRAADGSLRIVGRRATDLIKSGGFKIGAGEIEGALLEHPGVSEAAVTGEPDADLGERIVAWIVKAEGEAPSGDDLAAHVASLLTPHKRPRVVRFVDELPRNAMGKVQKARLRS